MKSKEGLYVKKRFNLSMGIAGKAFEYPGVCLESYGMLCLIEEQKAGPSGRFNNYGIYTVSRDKDGDDQLHALMIDYGKGGPMDPPIYGAPRDKVKEKFDAMVVAAKVSDEQAEARASQQAKEAEARSKEAELKARAEKVYNDKMAEIKTKQSEIESKLKELVNGKGLFTDKKIRELVTDSLVLDRISKCITK